MIIIRFNATKGGSYEFVCESVKTRNGFAHVCNILIRGCDMGKVKINYLNRTWEAWNFQNVCIKACEKYAFEDDKEEILQFLKTRDGY